MKLISLYITAFGGVTDRAFSFDGGVTELLDRNGAGKSTLAAFLKVMLFGLEKNGNSILDNEAALYEPWQGGRFGGSLTLEHRGEIFRIERHYERVGKLKTRTELRVLNESTGLPTDALGEEPGRTLLGVDGPSFLRTAYLSSRGVTAGKTADISARLGGLEGEADDMANVETAIKLLKNKRSEIRTQNKQKNGQKLLDLAERERGAIEGDLAAARAASAALPEAEEGLSAIGTHLAALDADINTLRAAKTEADRRRGEREAAERRLAELGAEETAARDALAALDKHFPNGAPAAETLAALSSDAAEYAHVDQEWCAVSDLPDEPLPTDEEMAELRAAVRERREIKARPFEFRDPEDAIPAPRPSYIPTILLAIGGALALLALLFLFLRPPIGGVLLALDAVLFAAALTLRFREAKKCREELAAAEAERAKRTREAFDAAVREADERAALLLAGFGLAADADDTALDRLAARAAEKKARDAQKRRLSEARSDLAKRIERALSDYLALPLTPDPSTRVRALVELAQRRELAAGALARLEAEETKLRSAAKQNAPEEGPSPEQLASLLAECEERRRALAEKQTSSREALERTRAAADTLPALLDAEARLTAEIAEHEARILTLDRAAEFLASARASYEEAYLGGIRAHIGNYAALLFGDSMGEARLDLDLNLTFLSGGEAHSVQFESTGRRAIADICLRLALLDALYPDDPPPLILDDPFVALDEDNLKTALSLLRELGRERQILYLTCHPSRSIT